MINDIMITAKGLIDASLKGRSIIVKGFSDVGLIELKHMINEEVKLQNET